MNLLVTGAFDWTEEELNKLLELGHDVVFMQQEKSLLPCEADWVEGIIGNGIFLYHNIEKFKNLKFIQLTSAGFDRVPIDYIKENKISIFNAKGVYNTPMAEFAICGVLQILKQSKFFINNQTQHKWEKHRGLLELCGKTVSIIGCGSVGQECAKRYKAFGCKVLGVDLISLKSEYFDIIYSISEINKVLSFSDILVLTLPLTDSTHHLIDEEKICRLNKDAIIVNISRGGIIKTKALIDSLKNGHLMGAVLDVFEEEPLNRNSPLWNMENVILTPHNSFVGEGNKNRLLELIFNNLRVI